MGSPLEKRSFDVGINADDSLSKIGPGEYLNGFNFRGYTSEAGHVSGLQPIPGTKKLYDPNPVVPAGQLQPIYENLGSCVDQARRRILFFNWSSFGTHSISCWDNSTNTGYIVLMDSQVAGGLNFDRLHPIHSCFVINGNLYWVDDFNENRRVNIDAGIKMNTPGYAANVLPYVAPLNPSVIAWIRRQPGQPPAQAKVLLTPVPANNFIADQAFQFAYRYQYRDYEYSTLSGLSTLADFNEQDPPPTQSSLGIQNTNGFSIGPGGQNYLFTNFLLPNAPTPGYGIGVLAKITRMGTAGPLAVSTDIPIALDWSQYPATKTYTQVIVAGVAAYFSQLAGNGNPGGTNQGGNWYISYRDGVHPTLNIKANWDWGLGDNTFPPTTLANLTLYAATPSSSRQYSRIDVAIPLTEKIDQDVIQVDLVANYLVSGNYFIIKSWKTSLAADAAAITAHNATTAPLAYQFFNNQIGLPLDSAYSVKPFDSAPIVSGTAELAKNRVFLAKNRMGYDTPNTTSLALSTTTRTIGSSAIGAILGEWNLIRFSSGFSGYFMASPTPIGGTQPFGPVYYYTTVGAAPPFPQSINAGLIYIGNTLAQVQRYFITTYGFIAIGSYVTVDQNQSSALTAQGQSINFGVAGKVFKSNSSYQACITFYDNYGRKCGALTNQTLIVQTPNTGFSSNQYVTAINWALSNANAAGEIPTTAYYYSVGLTKCLRTRFFIEAIGFIIYASKDATGKYAFTNGIYSTDWAGVAINTSFLTSNGMGYVYSPGDVITVYLAGSYYSMAIIDQSGTYIICSLQNLGVLGGSSLALYEIYTPYKQLTDEPYFEMGQIYPVSNAGTVNRNYSTIADNIGGDVFLIQRQNSQNSFQTYMTEAMSPNNKFYKVWLTDAGRPNFIDQIGQVQKLVSGVYSNTLVAGSKTNGLSTFEALNTWDLDLGFQAVQKLMLTSKIQKEGSIMLAICTTETVSLYLGETQIAAPQGNAFLAVSAGVIGTVYPLKGSYGTINPEGVKQYEGNVFWPDAYNGAIIQYSNNGLEKISKFKTMAFWRKFFIKYLSMTQAQILALGSRPFLVGGIDPYNGEYLLSIPKLEANYPATLPSYGLTPPPDLFEVYDGQAKTMVYKIEKNKWMPACSFAAESMVNEADQLFGFKAGAAYLHNDAGSGLNQFYGTTYPSIILFALSDIENIPKRYNAINVESTLQPDTCIFMSDYPNLQITDLVGTDWNNKEGVFYTCLFRDRLSPGYTDVNVALNYGGKILGKTPKVQLNFNATKQFTLKYVNVLYQLSSGHKTVAQK